MLHSPARPVKNRPRLIDFARTQARREDTGSPAALKCQGIVGSVVARVRAGLAGGLFEVGDAPVGDGELVFKADDAGSRGQWHVLIEQGPDPGSQREIGPAVAALPARRAPRTQQPRGIQAAQKRGLHTEQLRGGTHRVGRVVDIVELVRGAALGRVTTKRALAAAINQGCQGPLAGWALLLDDGSPTGYRRAVRENPNLVIAMRESNAPSPPVSQSAVITSSRRNNLSLRAR